MLDFFWRLIRAYSQAVPFCRELNISDQEAQEANENAGKINADIWASWLPIGQERSEGTPGRYDEETASIHFVKLAVLGAAGVGKTAILEVGQS